MEKKDVEDDVNDIKVDIDDEGPRVPAASATASSGSEPPAQPAAVAERKEPRFTSGRDGVGCEGSSSGLERGVKAFLGFLIFLLQYWESTLGRQNCLPRCSALVRKRFRYWWPTSLQTVKRRAWLFLTPQAVSWASQLTW